MCSLCNSSPCVSRCPNAPEPIAVATCDYCHESIYRGEEYGEINGKAYCESCLEIMPYSEMIELFGGKWRLAEEPDAGY